MRIAVLAGGTGTERNVSLTTSLNVYKALKALGHSAGIIDVFYGSEGASASDFFSIEQDADALIERLRDYNAKADVQAEQRRKEGLAFFGEGVLDICRESDIVFMGLHGENGENGKIQAAFDLLGIKYTGPGYFSSALSMDKEVSKKILMPAGVPMPHGKVLIKDVTFAENELPLPCVVKPACGGSSVGVTIAEDEETRKKAIAEAFVLEDKILVEDYVEGREFSVGVIAGKAMPIVEIIPVGGFYDYAHKYDPDGAKEVCPADIPEDVARQMQLFAELACETVGIDTYSRVDQLLDGEGNVFCLEINTLPGMTPTSLLPKEAAALGMSYEELVQKLVDVSLDKYR